MSRLNGKASEVLDTILSLESPEVRAKVYEIINVSGLEADDPMFLILALTGQMRVFLEAAPTELSKLLTEWKTQNAQSLSEIIDAIERIKETQQQQADSLAQNLEIVGDRCVSDFKEAGMAATSAIAEANSETLAKARQARNETEQLKQELMRLYGNIEADRQTNHNVIKAVLERVGKSTKELDKAVAQIDRSHSNIERLQKNTIWVKLTDWLSPVVVLGFWGMLCMGIGMRFSEYLYPRSVKLSGRELMDWNLDRLIKCQKDNNPKCTFWIVPPELRK